jgi:alkaline phosphatase D
MIYADNSIPPIVVTTVGNWTNNPTKDFAAVTLDEFRANWKYNHGDDKMQSFLSKTPIFVQWDDHEVTNNWYPNEILGDPLYEEGLSANTLYENSLQALYEFNPIEEGSSIYRSQKFGKHLEIFFPDFRSFRDPNPENEEPDPSAMMGPEQLQWLKDGLLASTATWKIISSHDPFGIVTGSEGDFDAFGNDLPEILGREHELKELLAFINNNKIMGVVSLTSDVHFTAHVNMDPSRAEGGFTDFQPLDEYVIGPIHAGSFGPNFMDTSFGAQYEYGKCCCFPT